MDFIGKAKLFIISILILCFVYTPAYSLLKVDIDKGVLEPIPVAIQINTPNPFDIEIASNIVNIINNDLNLSGIFEIVPVYMHPERQDIEDTPLFKKWRNINANKLIIIDLKPNDNTLQAKVRLWDAILEKEGRPFITTDIRNKFRVIAHKIADEIYEQTTGAHGYFNSKVIFVTEVGSGIKKKKKLAIMDQDSYGYKEITDGRHLVLTPRLDNKRGRILYMSYHNLVPRVYMLDLLSNRTKVIGDFPGMSFAPRFSPDGQNALVSIAKDGATNINIVNLRSKEVKTLTHSKKSINTSPSYSPDGEKIVFNSDRNGVPQLFIMDKNGKNQHLVSKGEGSYTSPVWSPRGDYIAFVKIHRGQFYIGVMRPDGSGERMLTQSWSDEGPTWAPNGRVIMFAREDKYSKLSKLYAVDINGYNMRQISTPYGASDPAWAEGIYN